MRWYVVVGGTITAVLLLLVSWLSTLNFRRSIMQAVVALLFRVAFTPLVRVTAAALAPIFANLTLDKAQIKDVILKVGAVLEGKTVTFEVMGMYSASEQQDIVEGVADMLKAILVDFGITQAPSDIGRLLTAVATKLAV